jgi:hypothetical protein
LARDIECSDFAFPQDVTDIAAFAFDKTFAALTSLNGVSVSSVDS